MDGCMMQLVTDAPWSAEDYEKVVIVLYHRLHH